MSKGLSGIKHIVVLMFENRSFDHIFGGLSWVNGLLLPDGKVNPEYYNVPYPTQPPTPEPSLLNPKIYPAPIDTSYVLAHDFNHDFGDGMMPDLFGPGTTGHVGGKPIGAPAVTYPATNSGFYSTICWDVKDRPLQGPGALTYFKHGSLQALHKLAEEFVVCDNWHCDMPGHTMPNRAFMHCATTGTTGICDSDQGTIFNSSIFELIEGAALTWSIYAPGPHNDSSWMNYYIASSPNAQKTMQDFVTDADNGTLPFYSFVMCWTGSGPYCDTSMHPASPIQAGENLLAGVYNTLYNSPSWENTLLIVNFDENGGMYDHVVPPATVQPTAGPPQGSINLHTGQLNAFDFQLLGPRIPVLIISPWLAKGVDSTQYQNTSVLRFLEDWMVPAGTGSGKFPVSVSLTSRDANATSIAAALERFGLGTMRTDTPYPLPYHSGYAWDQGLTGPQPGVCADEAGQPPLPHMVEVAKMYVTPLPGHPDSGKPIDRGFKTAAELDSYVRERKEAARLYWEGAS